MKQIHLEYYAQLREQAGREHDTVHTEAVSPGTLYEELRARHGFTVAAGSMKVAVNARFVDWLQPLADGDTVVFIPPVAGG